MWSGNSNHASVDLFGGLNAAGGTVPVAVAGGSTSNDSEPSPATTASPASQGRAGTAALPAGVPAAVKASNGAAPQSAPVASTSAASGKVKRRKWTAQERAEHSTIERKRREDFNSDLLDLARKLPSIGHIKRVNKRVIVKAACRHVDTERKLVLDVLPDVRALVQERDDCLRELNEFRRAAGKQERPTAIDATAGIENLSRVEQYAFSAFAGGLGGNEDDEMDTEQTNQPEQAQVKPAASTAASAAPVARSNSSQAVPATEASSSNAGSNVLSSYNALFSPQSQNAGLLFDEAALSTSTSGGSAASNIFAAFPQNSPTPADVAQLLSDQSIQDMAVRHLLNSPSFQEALRGSMNRYQPAQTSPYSFGQVVNAFNFGQVLPAQFPGGTGLTPPQNYQNAQTPHPQNQQQQSPHDGPFQNPLSPMSAFLYSYGPSPGNPQYPS